ncbi:MAG: hypothetical protein DCC43_15330 [Candidatus Brocadia sp.]|nr:hypothetical protein [Candidatus Brocadia sp. AMX3]MDG5996934.1 hypothetical protein [Candidatus Brocadia sp.]RIJ89454.1 MAG: hypothetical protein DCC43_15330 [Candidatus Brocadia sp.]
MHGLQKAENEQRDGKNSEGAVKRPLNLCARNGACGNTQKPCAKYDTQTEFVAIKTFRNSRISSTCAMVA